jgi:hypothetical protein
LAVFPPPAPCVTLAGQQGKEGMAQDNELEHFKRRIDLRE